MSRSIFGKGTTTADLLIQVRKLKEDCVSLRQIFISILQQLKSVADNSFLPLDHAKELKRFIDIWDRHCGVTYVQIIWRSRYIAEKAEESANFLGLLYNLLHNCKTAYTVFSLT
ncbi:unnamed protein product [Somion occarium]|uniref:Uncharacterized protein n=1 Tax=Somion occarium TaxID=3059160 RepID=A0ABP1E6R7_9APHY